MKIFGILFLVLSSLSPGLALAQSIKCAKIGRMEFNGDVAELTYAPAMGFRETRDIAYFVSMSSSVSVYRVNIWGAYVTIPNALLNGQVGASLVTFGVPKAAPVSDTCTLE